MSERCDRCGSVGEDRRTLWMACFYQMGELGLPFQEYAILGQPCEQAGTETVNLAGMSFAHPKWGDPQGEPNHHAFYTLRVCKRCRSEWMAAIRGWFQRKPEGQDHDADDYDPGNGCGSGIFVREGGAIREITREEWDAKYPGREPVIAPGHEGEPED